MSGIEDLEVILFPLLLDSACRLGLELPAEELAVVLANEPVVPLESLELLLDLGNLLDPRLVAYDASLNF